MGGGSQRGDSSGGAVMPGVVMMTELQSRMSKKISQLARVIHHLNDRGDDDPSSSPTGGIRTSDLGGDLVTVADRYDTETEQILADAAAKVQSFHRACARKEEAAGLAHAVNALRSEHEAAAASHDREMAKLRESNARALADAENKFANVKFAMDELRRTSKAEVASLESELATARAEAANASDGIRTSDLMAAHARELDRVRARHSEETNDLAKNHAEELDARLSAARREAEETMRDLRAAVTDATSRARRGESETAKIRRDLEARDADVENFRSRLHSETARADGLERELGDSTRRGEAEHRNLVDAVREAHDRERAALEANVASLEGELSRLRDASAAQTAAERETTTRLVAERESLKTALSVTEAKLADAERKTLEALARASDAESTNRRLTLGAESQSNELERSLVERAASDAALRDAEGKTAALVTANEALAEETATLRSELAAEKKAAEETRARLETLETANKTANETLAAKLRDAEKALDVAVASHRGGASAEEAKELRGRLVESEAKIAELEANAARLTTELAGARSEAEASARKEHDARFTALRAEHSKKLDAERARFDSLVEAATREATDRLRRENEALRAKEAETKVRHDDAFRGCVQEGDKRVAKALEEGQRVRNDLKMQIAELSKSLADERDGALKSHEEKLALIDDVARAKRAADEANERREAMERSHGAKEAELAEKEDAMRRAAELARRNQGEVAAQCERLREELRAAGEKARENARVAEERLARELKRRDEEWTRRAADLIQERCDALSEAHATETRSAVEAALADAETRFQTRLASSLESHETANAAMAARMDAERVRLEAAAEDAMNELAAAREGEKEAITELRALHESRVKKLEEDAAASIAEMVSKHASERDESNARHAAESAHVVETHELAMSAAAEKAEKALWDQRVDLETAAAAAVDEWRKRREDDVARLAAERRTQLGDLKEKLTREHVATLARSRREWESREEELLANFHASCDAASELADEKATLAANAQSDARTIENLRRRLDCTEAAAAMNATRMARERSIAESEQSRVFQSELASVRAEHEATTTRLSSRASAVERTLRESVREWTVKYEALEARFEARESREEDIARIARLERAVAEKENEVAEWRGHSEQTRLELRNREGTFTQAAFGNGAATLKADAEGVMDWMLGGKKDKARSGRKTLKF
uniref:Protein FAM184A/B N-terminal domain-containing protein n=1 Tax=Micromonas pusilla TaxID=38833 RepID=A0A7S0ID05_MICPS|mmetsp:Transcript_2535/g.10272  ORF Transcript_2535/g.10272 Transcript_2535/m.10272 type:complete len:1175 (+) Transcript_2535:206-3730(+)